MARYYHVLPTPVRNKMIMPLLDQLPYSMRKLKTAARNLSQPVPQRWMSWFGIFNGQLKENILSESIKASIDIDSSRVFRRWLENNPQRDNLSSMLYLDTRIWLPDNLLMKGDKMTMAASLEARMPLLDYQLTEYAASIPSNAKVKPFKAKYLFKRAYADFLPDAILTRKKMGFNVPTGTWFREGQRNLITRLLLSDRARGRGYLNDAFVASLLRDHLEGRTNYQSQLFILASLELWFRVFIDSPDLVRPQMSVEELLDDKEIGSQFLAPQK
jgi:asparagine synthase (glutamine-hydrolysing)